jgi:thymidylate kinase
MVTVALIGADGAGKTSVARRLEEEGALPIKYLYMGVNPEAATQMLVSTRLLLSVKRRLGKASPAGGPPDPSLKKPPPSGMWKRALHGLRSSLRMANQLGEEWFRQLLAWYYQGRGYVVLFDRHFYADYHAHDVSGASGPRSLSRRLHGFVLRRLYPRPDLVILLDAPSQVLFDRKREGTIELIERRRQEYIRLQKEMPEMAIVDVSQPLDLVKREVLELIRLRLPAAIKDDLA